MSINVDVSYNGNTIATLSDQISVPVTYGGNTIVTINSAGIKTLGCANKYMSTNVGIGSSILNCSGKIMSTDIVLTATEADTKLYLIKGNPIDLCTDVTRTWISSNIRWSNKWSGQYRNAPSISTSGDYITITNGTTSTNTTNIYVGAYQAGASNAGTPTGGLYNDLTGYTKLVLKYDLTTTGSVSDYRKFMVALYATTTAMSSAWYVLQYADDVVSSTPIKAGVTLTDQTLTLDLSKNGGYMLVGICANEQSNPGVRGTITVKELYAEK